MHMNDNVKNNYIMQYIQKLFNLYQFEYVWQLEG